MGRGGDPKPGAHAPSRRDDRAPGGRDGREVPSGAAVRSVDGAPWLGPPRPAGKPLRLADVGPWFPPLHRPDRAAGLGEVERRGRLGWPDAPALSHGKARIIRPVSQSSDELIREFCDALNTGDLER